MTTGNWFQNVAEKRLDLADMKKLPQTCSSLPRFPQTYIGGSGGEDTGLGEEDHRIKSLQKQLQRL